MTDPAGAILDPIREAVDRTLDRLLADVPAPSRIVEAVRYAALSPGKRIRPALLVASGEAVGGRREELLEPACAVEMVHAFSLVHDDLPALDDDSLRRGRPTVHVRFGEATAILAGDALLALAFETLARFPEGERHAARKLEAIRVVAAAAGLAGMVGGQVLDLEHEGRPAGAADLERIHRLKTGALIAAACVAGGILGGGGASEVEALRRYGEALGLAFQITDDVLDVEGTAGVLGKSPGKDARAAKATFPGVHGLEASRRMAAAAVERAVAALGALEDRGGALAAIARGVGARRR
jgi:geranylgeranyl pyrophosphate synthase